MSNKPLVSVVMPVYNSEEFVELAIRSVLQQTYSNLQLLIVDDCSSDQSVAMAVLAAGSDPRVEIHSLASNSGGPAAPRNKGLDLARGEYIAFLDADDCWHPHKLSVQVKFMINQGMEFSCSKVILFSQSSELAEDLSVRLVDETSFETIDHKRLMKKNMVATSSVIFCASVLGPQRFSTDRRYVGIEDYILWLKLHKKGSLSSSRLEQKLVFYRSSVGSLSRNKIEMSRKIWSLLGEECSGSDLPFLRRTYYFAWYIILSLLSVTYK